MARPPSILPFLSSFVFEIDFVVDGGGHKVEEGFFFGFLLCAF